MLTVEIQDDTCTEDEVIRLSVPLETSKMDIMLAIETLYPKATDVRIFVDDDTE